MGIDTYLYREYGYAPRGTAIQGIVSGRKYKRVGIVVAKLGKEIVAPLEYSGTMDNASFHRKKQLHSLTEENSCHSIFLPPYSPELNPIEKFWGWLKRHLQKILQRFDTFDEALYECFKVV